MKTEKRFEIKEDFVRVFVDPELYHIDAVYSASYVFLDTAYIMLDGNPKKGIYVELRPKKHIQSKNDLELLGREFANELINFSDYQERSNSTRKMRELLMQRALFTNDPDAFKKEYDKGESEKFDKLLQELEDDNEFLEDPEKISVPWEEKYGKETKDSKK